MEQTQILIIPAIIFLAVFLRQRSAFTNRRLLVTASIFLALAAIGDSLELLISNKLLAIPFLPVVLTFLWVVGYLCSWSVFKTSTLTYRRWLSVASLVIVVIMILGIAGLLLLSLSGFLG